jgi:hypothetical protein
MKILLRWLVEHAWIFYVVCAIGALIYLVRALVAQRERSLALFTLELETATVRAVRAWAMTFVFIAVALLVFIGVTFALPRLPAYNSEVPLPTSTPNSGVDLPTPSATAPVTGSVSMPTLPAQTATPPVAASPPNATVPPTAGPTITPTATAVAAGAFSGELDVRFGDFGRLIGYKLSSTEIAAGESLILTLYWLGLEGRSPTDYTVFTHLFSQDGNLIAQHDGPPAGGSEPTGEWEAGQTIEDTHQMAFRSEGRDYAGPATVIVGLYNPGDMSARVMTSEGQDYVTLPLTINVVPQ